MPASQSTIDKDQAKHEERTTTLLRLAKTIASGRKTFGELLEAVQQERPIGQRTLFRYLDALRKIGYPIELDENKRYRFADSFSVAQLALPTEALTALATLRNFANVLHPSIVQSIDRLIPEIESAQSAYAIPMDPVSLDPEVQAIRTILEEAQRRHQVVQFQYVDREGAQSTREAEIYSFVISRGRVYAKARDINKDSPRSFALDGMSDVVLTPRFFTPLPSFIESTSGKGSFSGLYDGPTFEAHIRFTKHVAKSAQRSRLSQHATPLHLLDGGVELVLRVASEEELISWVMSFGGAAEVLSPESVRNGVARRAIELARTHTIKATG